MHNAPAYQISAKSLDELLIQQILRPFSGGTISYPLVLRIERIKLHQICEDMGQSSEQRMNVSGCQYVAAFRNEISRRFRYEGPLFRTYVILTLTPNHKP